MSTPVAFGLHLTSRMGVFRERYPGLSLELVIRDGLFADLVEEGLDLAIRVGDGPEASIIARHAGSVRLLTVAAPAYLASRAAPTVPADLAEHDCLVFRFSPRSHEWAFDGPEGHVVVPVSGPFSANNSEAIHQAVLDGLGIGSLSELLVGPDLLSGRLQPVLAAYHRPEMPVYVVYPSRRNLPLRTRAVIDFVIGEAAQCRAFGIANRHEQ
jgi:DNA-binding transcriptional LysR family regulator